MTLSRRTFLRAFLRAFLGGVAALLAWPWGRKTGPSYEATIYGLDEFGRPAKETITYGPDSDIVQLLNQHPPIIDG